MLISAKPAIQQISPASTDSTSTLFKPSYVNSFVTLELMFPFSLQITTLSPCFTEPLSTLPIASLPK